MSTTPDIERLMALAAKATPARWDLHCGYLVRGIFGDYAVPIVEGSQPSRAGLGAIEANSEGHANMQFIAACDPPTIAALCQEVQSLRAEAQEAALQGLSDERQAMEQQDEIASLRAQLEAAQQSEIAALALALLARMRQACGDNGVRMQDELEQYLRELVEDGARYRWLRDEGPAIAKFWRRAAADSSIVLETLDREVDTARKEGPSNAD